MFPFAIKFRNVGDARVKDIWLSLLTSPKKGWKSKLIIFAFLSSSAEGLFCPKLKALLIGVVLN